MQKRTTHASACMRRINKGNEQMHVTAVREASAIQFNALARIMRISTGNTLTRVCVVATARRHQANAVQYTLTHVAFGGAITRRTASKRTGRTFTHMQPPINWQGMCD